MSINIRKGDTVRVLWGRDEGKTGKVLRALPGKGLVVVEGVNIVKRHTRAGRKVRQAGIIEKPAALPVGKVMVVCPSCSRPTRVRREERAEYGRVRVCARCGEIVDAVK